MTHCGAVFCPYCHQPIPLRPELGKLRLYPKAKLILYYLLDRLGQTVSYTKIEAEFDLEKYAVRMYGTKINNALSEQNKPYVVRFTEGGMGIVKFINAEELAYVDDSSAERP